MNTTDSDPLRSPVYGVAVKYLGVRFDAGTCDVSRVYADGACAPLPCYFPGIAPTHQWGHGGTGAGQLAYSLLLDVMGPVFANALWERFKWAVVARLAVDVWELERDEVVAFARTVACGEPVVIVKGGGQ